MMMVVALLPLSSGYLVNENSKWHMLKPVAKENTWQNWEDLVSFMRSIEQQERIITDPITGYVLAATTTHRLVDREKFFPIPVDYRLANADLNLRGLRRYHDMLLVVNHRHGGVSDIAVYGRHWRVDELNTSRHYSPAFLELLNTHPASFLPVHAADDWLVFRVITR